MGVFGNIATQKQLAVGRFTIDEVELFYANLLSFTSILGIVAGFWLHSRLNAKVWWLAVFRQTSQGRPVFKPETLVKGFVFGGMILSHVFVYPSQWGQLHILVAGALTSIGGIADVGFGMAAYLVARGSARMRWMLLTLWPLHLLLLVLTFSKSAMVTALLFPAIGAYLGHKRLWKLIIACLGIMVVYGLAQDFVHFGRAEIMSRTGTIWRAGYLERVGIVQKYFRYKVGDSVANHALEEESWWLRLNYSQVQALAMRFRERGRFIDTLGNAWALFIPRVIWPGKPRYIAPGIKFYTLVTRNTGTSLGLSVFGDVYWQFGWAGIVVIMPLIGWFFAMMSWRSVQVMLHHNYIRMPLVLLSITTAAGGLTQFFVNGIIAVIPMYVAYALLINVLEKYLRSQRRRRTASGWQGSARRKINLEKKVESSEGSPYAGN